jgi:hypothetical protein
MIIYLNIGVVLFGSCSRVIMMTPRVDPRTERGVRMWNRDRWFSPGCGMMDRLRKRVSIIKNSNDNFKYYTYENYTNYTVLYLRYTYGIPYSIPYINFQYFSITTEFHSFPFWSDFFIFLYLYIFLSFLYYISILVCLKLTMHLPFSSFSCFPIIV